MYRKSASCTHVSALLHALVSLTAPQFQLQPSELESQDVLHSCDEETVPVTSRPCQWKAPKKRKESTMAMSEASFIKHEYCVVFFPLYGLYNGDGCSILQPFRKNEMLTSSYCCLLYLLERPSLYYNTFSLHAVLSVLHQKMMIGHHEVVVMRSEGKFSCVNN